MISVEEARERILSFVPLLDAEDTPIDDALGQAVAEDVVAGFAIPPLDNTSMDGYAVRAADTTGASAASPVTLRVVGELAAGYVYDGRVEPGTAVRIMTGAPMPAGADSVVPFEETDEPEGRNFGSFAKSRPEVGVLKAALPGANIRRAGEDVVPGAVILPRGTVLHPPQIGVLASLGMATVRVHRRPVVAILSTGDEIVAPGEPLKAGQIYDSNAHSVAAMVREIGGVPKMLGIASDTPEMLEARLKDGLDADLLVTSAGVSRGDYDVVKDVLMKHGEINFWTVRMRPGKPLAFGTFPSGEPPRPAHRTARQSRQLDGLVRAVRPPRAVQDARQDRLGTPARDGHLRRAHREHDAHAVLPARHPVAAQRPPARRPHRLPGLRHPHVDGRRQRPRHRPRRPARRRRRRRSRVHAPRLAVNEAVSPITTDRSTTTWFHNSDPRSSLPYPSDALISSHNPLLLQLPLRLAFSLLPHLRSPALFLLPRLPSPDSRPPFSRAPYVTNSRLAHASSPSPGPPPSPRVLMSPIRIRTLVAINASREALPLRRIRSCEWMLRPVRRPKTRVLHVKQCP